MSLIPAGFEQKFRRAATEAGEPLKDVERVLMPYIDRIMTAAYGKMGLTDPAALSYAVGLQRKNFQKIFTAKFDDEFVSIVLELEKFHHSRLGLSMDNYFYRLCNLLNVFAAVLVKHMFYKPKKLVAAIKSMNTVLFVGIDMTLTMHIREIEAEARAARARIADGLDQSVSGVVGRLTGSADELAEAAQTMADAAADTNRLAGSVGAAAGRAAHNVETVAAAAEELSASIGEIARQVSISSEIAGKAVVEARRTNATVEGLSEAAARIGEVVKLINDIAGQTNLLALNATIEAARAGEAGKGFAVVANEVKNLANQTARATGDITAQVQAIQAATEEAVAVMRGITGTIEEIDHIAASIASAVDEQGKATREIARNVAEASSGTIEVTSSVETVTERADQSGVAAAGVLDTSRTVSQQAAELQAALTQFLANIRAA
ncbi:MAG TPA: methyl-accepting chemotaxis protein [Azospirillaceae bacterium]|nr:methyl-accepting chemotaxis protein [Azospirillaceae bacterium]